MQAPDPHPCESLRLQALRDLGLLDTPPDPAFDALTETARRLFGVPMALVSLVDEHRQWFKSRQGLDAPETPRDISFCGHAILQEDIFCVEDATLDARFADNPLVTGGLGLRFYAGIPLLGPEGLPYGTLCLLDRRPRAFSEEDRAALRSLGLLAERLMARVAADKTEAEARLAALLDQLAEGIVFQDLTGAIRSANAAACSILGLTEDQLHGRSSIDPRWRCIHPDGSPFPGDTHPAMQTLRSGEPSLGQVMGVQKPDGSLTWILVNAMPVRVGGKLTGVACSFTDLTPFRAAEGEIHRKEERFQAIARNVPGMVYRFVVHPDGSHSFPFVGDQVESLYGLSPEAWQSNPAFALEAILPEDRPGYEAAYARASAELSTFLWEGRTRTARPGELKWIRCQSSPCRLEDGSLQWDGFLMDITPLRHAEEAFRRQEAFQRAVLDSARVAIIATDLDGLVTAINPFGADLLGHAPQDLIGRATPALWHDPAEVVARAADLSQQHGTPVAPGFEVFVHEARQGGMDQREWTFITREGRRVPVWLAVSGIHDERGALIGFIGVASDLSALRQTESAYRLLAERTTDIIARHDPEGRFIFVTPACERVLGYTAEEMLGRLPTDFLLAEDVPVMQKAHAAVLRGEPGQPFRYRARRRDGRVLWLESTGTAVRTGGAGSGPETVYTTRDITAQVGMEEALRASESRLRALFEAMPDLIFLVRRDGALLEAHTHPEAGLPTLPETGQGLTLRDLMSSEEADQRIQLIARVLATGRMETYESRMDTPSGPLDHESRMVPCGPDTVLLIARDITERKAVERLKGEFVATVSHELRTPITAIRGALGLLEAGVGGEVPPQAGDLLDLARANTERLLRLVNDILDFEKAESGKLALDLQTQDLAALIDASVTAAGPFAASLGVAYQWVAPAGAAWARVDGVRFQQIMANLLSNAAKYSPKETPVLVRLRKEGRLWRVEVENQGPPIPEAFRPHVFERFAMADGTDARRRGGSGLGLAISQSLIHRMGGQIGFTSDASGTCFFLHLPIETAP